jgi:2-dehydropantoate 2-reductase
MTSQFPGKNKEKILIIGTGAMATYFAARLASCADITLLGTWQEAIDQLNQHGARLVRADGREEAYRVKATHDPEMCRDFKLALFLVKSRQTRFAAARLANCIPEDGLVVTLQNGLGNLEKLSDTLGAERVALGVTTYGATSLGPGIVREGGSGAVHFSIDPRLGLLSRLLQEAGFVVEEAENLDQVLWGKLVINCAINPLAALLRVPNGNLVSTPHTRVLLQAAAREVAAVARAKGIDLGNEDPALRAVEAAEQTATNRSSMLQDVERGEITEIDAINGAVVKLGRGMRVPVPTNEVLWRLVHSLKPGEGGKSE